MRTKHLTLVIVPMLLTACGGQKTLQQDVYDNQYDCSLDWNYELCEPESSSYTGSTASSGGIRYIGPQYYSNNRKVRFRGSKITAYGNRSVRAPLISTRINSQAKSTPIRGGFGRGGGSFGG
ncbi:hypothetical protein [Acinetobacter tianfuensis]|uniref:Lipoprotein n=1 Tax=Acinetobacter tianfuensis TaxID=2419603 RepID=A0A3A8E7T6_9GAMM|nr:hypothetical protein [Acinetobacter tianfuensis]RKG30239.1 hypothetical protein D7V32_11805 [Acinetobacter tianfuensis]